MSSPAAQLAIGSIGAYQRFLSPHKGFCCAHHACTGGMTCSNYALHAIRELGLFGALPRIRERLVQCSEYATDPRKGKISEEDPGPLKLGDTECCIAYGIGDCGATACFSIFS